MKIYSNFQNELQDIGSRPTLLIISSFADRTCIHTSPNIEEPNEWTNRDENEQLSNIYLKIYDINWATKQLDIEQINKMIKNLVTQKPDADNASINYSYASSDSDPFQIEESFSDDSGSVGLSERMKGQKLTLIQVKYIKDYIEELKSRIKEICYKF